ncbi:MAG: hypothetical protein KBD06_03480 [Candidatus Pacebacteria bacterium]|nr:hypothetical protein [Candidatus Paceibacterota bacterium]
MANTRLYLIAAIPTDTQCTGYLKLGKESFDVAAPYLLKDAPSAGLYTFIREADLTNAIMDMKIDYGTVALFFKNTKTSEVMCIHGGVDDVSGHLFHPDFALSMHNHELWKLQKAIRESGDVTIELRHQGLSGIRKSFRRPVQRRVVPRLVIPTDSDNMKQIIRWRMNNVAGTDQDIILVRSKLFFLVAMSDHGRVYEVMPDGGVHTTGDRPLGSLHSETLGRGETHFNPTRQNNIGYGGRFPDIGQVVIVPTDDANPIDATEQEARRLRARVAMEQFSAGQLTDHGIAARIDEIGAIAAPPVATKEK